MKVYNLEKEIEEKYKTYITRHEVVLKKFVEDTNRVVTKGTTDYDDLIIRLDLFEQLTETLYDIINIQRDSLKQSVAILKTALRIYSLKFGSELVVPEGFIEFGEKLEIKVDVVPEPGKITVTVEKQNE